MPALKSLDLMQHRQMALSIDETDAKHIFRCGPRFLAVQWVLSGSSGGSATREREWKADSNRRGQLGGAISQSECFHTT